MKSIYPKLVLLLLPFLWIGCRSETRPPLGFPSYIYQPEIDRQASTSIARYFLALQTEDWETIHALDPQGEILTVSELTEIYLETDLSRFKEIDINSIEYRWFATKEVEFGANVFPSNVVGGTLGISSNMVEDSLSPLVEGRGRWGKLFGTVQLDGGGQVPFLATFTRLNTQDEWHVWHITLFAETQVERCDAPAPDQVIDICNVRPIGRGLDSRARGTLLAVDYTYDGASQTLCVSDHIEVNAGVESFRTGREYDVSFEDAISTYADLPSWPCFDAEPSGTFYVVTYDSFTTTDQILLGEKDQAYYTTDLTLYLTKFEETIYWEERFWGSPAFAGSYIAISPIDQFKINRIAPDERYILDVRP